MFGSTLNGAAFFMRYRKRIMMQHERRFTATDDNGNAYQIIETTLYIDNTSLNSNRKEQLENGKEYETSGGRKVNLISKGHYEIVGLPNIPLTSNDVNAP